MTLGALIYFGLLALWSACITYVVLFNVIPALFGGKREGTHAPVHHAPVHHAPPHHAHAKHAPRTRYSAREGFRSFAQGVELTVEDIVKGLSREL